jgi:hypothetical protein
MKQQRVGAGLPSTWIRDLADSLLDRYPETICLATSLVIIQNGGRPEQLDFLAVTTAAIFAGIEWQPERRGAVEPGQAAQLIVKRLQAERLVAQPIPVYVVWLGQAVPPDVSHDLPVLNSVAAVVEFMLLVSRDLPHLPEKSVIPLFEGLLQLDISLSDPQRRQTPPLRRALRDLGNLPGRLDQSLQDFIRQPPLLHGSRQIQPADVNRHLERALFNRDNHLEDTGYQKIAPNDYLIALDPENYERRYRPIAEQLCQGWQSHLLEALNTANSRAGRKEFRFGGPVQVQVKPEAEIGAGQLRIYCRVNPDIAATATTTETACLESPVTGRRYPLPPGLTTIGRDAACDIPLTDALAQEKRLISGQHAYVLAEKGEYLLFDGTPSGKASTNGTFVNGRRVAAGGYPLPDGCQIILASLDANHPRPDTPGVVSFLFHKRCPEGRHDR